MTQGSLFARRLITGPAGCGKSHLLLRLFMDSWSESSKASPLFIVPTVSARDHTRNSLLRMKLRISQTAILEGPGVHTFDNLLQQAQPLSRVRRDLLVQRLQAEMDHPYFRAMTAYPGFREALAREAEDAIEVTPPGQEIILRAGPAGAGGPSNAAFLDFLGRYQEATAPFQCPAATEAAPTLLLVDGFADFTPVQKQLLAQLAGRASMTVVALPEDSVEARAMLTSELGFIEERLSGNRRGEPAKQSLVCDDRRAEIDHTAREILDLVTHHHFHYREIGVIVQRPDAYLRLLADVFRGLDIPARSFFPTAAAETSLGRHLLACLRWLRAAPDEKNRAGLEILKSAWTPVANRDRVTRLEFQLAAGKLDRVPTDMLDVDMNPSASKTPADIASGMARAVLATWEALTPLREMTPGGLADHARVLELRADALTRRLAWQIPGEVAEAVRAEKATVDFAGFLALVERELTHARFRVRDRRTDAVNVMNAYEARQWELRAVFVLGMVEGEFPRVPRRPLFLADNSAQQRLEQKRLFSVATTRARERLTITRPRFDARGNELVTSRFVGAWGADILTYAPDPHPPATDAAIPRKTHLQLPQALAKIRERETIIRPSDLETYVNCAFQHFARYRMRLEGRPKQEAGLDSLLQGTIVHDTIMQWDRDRRAEDIGEVFQRVFAAKTSRLSLGYSGEKLRAAMLAGLRKFEQFERERATRYRTEVAPEYAEKEFLFPLVLADGTNVQVKGRVDRVEVRGNAGLAVDFKYKSQPYTKAPLLEALNENFQAAAYLLALKHWGLQPAGIEFHNLRGANTRRVGLLDESLIREITTEPPKNAVIQPVSDVMEDGLQRMRDVAAAIRAGNIEVEPKNTKYCHKGFCSYYDLCRVPKWRV